MMYTPALEPSMSITHLNISIYPVLKRAYKEKLNKGYKHNFEKNA